MTKGTSYNLDLFSAVKNCSSLVYKIRSGSGQNMARCIMWCFIFDFICEIISLLLLPLFNVIFNSILYTEI